MLIVGEHVQQVVADEVSVIVVPGEIQNALIAKSIFAGGVAHKVRFFFGLEIETRIVLKSIKASGNNKMRCYICANFVNIDRSDKKTAERSLNGHDLPAYDSRLLN